MSNKNKRIFSVCEEDYYLNAINEIKNMEKDPYFFIFSNDLDWVQTEFKIFNNLNVCFVDNSQFENCVIQDFSLMTNCKHNIIANSSFSWWSSWLNTNKNKIVIAPKNWYLGKLNNSTIDLIPASWIRVWYE